MKKADSGQIAKPNGGTRPAKTPARRPRRPQPEVPPGGNPAKAGNLAPFCELAPGAVDASAWPVHITLWLEPRMETGIPAASGLRVERTNRVPAGAFSASVEPFQGAVAPFENGPVPPPLRPAIPPSGLAPLGWEPRGMAPAGRSEAGIKTRLNTDVRGRVDGQ